MEKTKDGRKAEKIKCDFCGKEFYRAISEIKRNANLNRNNYCSRQCSIKGAALSRCGKRKYKTTEKQLSHLRDICGSSRDKYTPFRYLYRVISKRDNICDLTMDDLIRQWNSQNGICPYTGYKLILPENGNIKRIDFFHRASIDRIDSNKGYVKGNIQFVSTPINYMKLDRSDFEIKCFLKDIANHISSL